MATTAKIGEVVGQVQDRPSRCPNCGRMLQYGSHANCVDHPDNRE